MSDDATPYTPIGFPDTRLLSERLWVSSALSVLKARQREHCAPQRAERYLNMLYNDVIDMMTLLEEALSKEVEPPRADTERITPVELAKAVAAERNWRAMALGDWHFAAGEQWPHA